MRSFALQTRLPLLSPLSGVSNSLEDVRPPNQIRPDQTRPDQTRQIVMLLLDRQTKVSAADVRWVDGRRITEMWSLLNLLLPVQPPSPLLLLFVFLAPLFFLVVVVLVVHANQYTPLRW